MAQAPPALAERILVAEDDETSFFILKTLLSKQAVTVTRAVNGQDVFDKFKENPTGYDLILMDIEMPIVNGLEAAQKIRQFEVLKDLAPTMIVALTAHDEPEYHRKIFDARMNSIVQKPVRAAALLDAMKSALENKPLPMTIHPATENEPAIADDDIRAALEDVKRRLWADLNTYVSRIRTLVEFGDAESIRVLGHTIKGFGGHLLHPRITELGRAIQNAGADRRFGEVRQLAQELTEYIQRMEADSGAIAQRLMQLRLESPSPSLLAGATPQMEAPPSPTMEMDSVLLAMRAKFMQDVTQDIAKINAALKDGEFEVIARVGHILKGVGGNLGHAAVTDIGRAIEISALDRNADQLRRLVAELQSYVDSVTGRDETEQLDVPPALQRPLLRIDSKAERAGSPRDVQQFQRAVKATYVKDLPTYVDSIQIALDTADWASVDKTARSLHKAAGALKNDALEQLAKQLDDAATRKSLQDASAMARRLQLYLEQAPM